MSRRRGATAVLLAVLMALGGCSSAATGGPTSPSPSPSASDGLSQPTCQQAAEQVVAAVRERVASYEVSTTSASPSASSPAASGSPTPSSPGTAQLDPLTAAVAGARETIAQRKCSQSQFTSDLQAGLATIHPKGTIARAVLERISATLLGKMGQDSETKAVWPTEDLAQAAAEVAPGSTLELQAGTYRLSDSLVLLDEVTIEGAGKGRTIIESTAPDAAIVVATASPVEVTNLSLLLEPKVPASGVVSGPTAQLVLTNVRISGATSGNSQGGAAVQLAGTANQAAGTQTTLEVTGSQFDHNSWAGITVSGGHRVSVVSSTFSDNGQCGVCFLDAGSGSIDKSTFTNDAVALGATGTSAPVLLRSTISGGTVGIQVADKAAPIVDNVRITGAARAAVIFSGTAGGSMTNVTCAKNKYDIAIATTATPSLGKNSCTLVRGK